MIWPPGRPKREPKITKLKRPQNPQFVFCLQNKWFREQAKSPPTKEASNPKSGRKCPLYLESHVRARDEKNQKALRFNRNLRNATSQNGQPDSGSHREEQKKASLSLSALTRHRARNPYKTRAKALSGDSAHLGDQIPLLKGQNGTKFPSYSI